MKEADAGATRAFSEFSALVAVALRDFGDYRVLTTAGQEHIARALASDHEIGAHEESAELFEELFRVGRPCLVIPPWENRIVETCSAASETRTFDHPFGIIVPASDLVNRLPRRVEHLGEPRIVVEAQAQLPGLHPTFRVALVVIEPNDPQESRVTRFFQAPPDGNINLSELVADCERLMRQQGGSTEHGFIHRGESLKGKSLRPEDHDPALKAITADLADFGTGSLVCEVFEVLRSRPAAPGRAVEEAPSDRVRVIRGRDVTITGELLPENAQGDEERGGRFVDVTLEEGDLVMREIESLHQVGIPVEIKGCDLPLRAGNGLIVLRAKAPLEPEELEFYKLYLGTQRSRDVMRAAKLGSLRRLSGVQRMPLPRPDADLLAALRDIRRSQELLRAWASEGVGLTSVAFTGPAAEARRHLIETGRQLRQRAEAAEQVGTRDHRIANFYPYPIAHKWRLVRIAEGTDDNATTYEAILDCFEATMAFGAALALAFAHTNGLDVPVMKEVRRKLSTNGQGTSLGDWVNILKAVSSGKAFKNVDPDKPLASIRGLLPDGTQIAQAQERLSRRRNDESHQRRVDPIDLPGAVEASRADLEVILDHAGFLADLPVFQIKSARWDSLERRGEASAVALRGDHPVAPSVQLEHGQSDIETGSLYVRDLSGDLVLLRPFLVRSECPLCRTWSTFHPDRRANGVLLLKAVDHAHTISGADYEQAMRRVGYLA